MPRWIPGFLILPLTIWSSAAMLASADWPTHRGNPQRTGSAGDQPGPKKPKVLWVHRSREHYIASPIVSSKRLYVPGLGAFNTAALRGFALEPAADKQLVFSKTAPYLKLPVVSSPAVAEGKLIFGDGMHQTDGGVLHCLDVDTGLPLWQLSIPGKLVHLEGSPTIADGKVYMGGGNAGVFCVEFNRVTLEGKELGLAEVQAVMEKRWKELRLKYEEEKKKDPDFAIPPSEDLLPKPAPIRIWRQGQDKWHVDASVAVVGNRVLVASAYLDEERAGDRALLCLRAKDGTVLWNTPLRLNPWAGPTVAGNLVLVGCGSIRFDPKQVDKAKGEVVAVDLESGTIKWQKELAGGIVAPIAVKDQLAVFTATDGKVRAWEVATGAEKWTYEAKAPMFAGPALAGGAVYTADLKGVVHALTLADGKAVWTLDLGAEPAVKAPGMVYGSPVIHGGRLYLATCNLEGDHARKPTVVVCIGDQ